MTTLRTREEILAWLDDLERIVDKSIDAMDLSGYRIDRLEMALRRIRTINKKSAHYCEEIEGICRDVLARK